MPCVALHFFVTFVSAFPTKSDIIVATATRRRNFPYLQLSTSLFLWLNVLIPDSHDGSLRERLQMVGKRPNDCVIPTPLSAKTRRPSSHVFPRGKSARGKYIGKIDLQCLALAEGMM